MRFKLDKQILFIGEEKSPTAVRKGWSWEDGRLAAKQLFDGLKGAEDIIKVIPKECKFVNLFEEDGKALVNSRKLYNYIVIALGDKVSKGLDNRAIKHYKMVHPAARGKIRKKENYINHTREVLKEIRSDEEKAQIFWTKVISK
tara:strand:+ start:9116 stop:9547 length:432 start_codon:yes stop_codon:yes gene_type:complete